MKYLGKQKGFANRLFTHPGQTPFLPSVNITKERSHMSISDIINDIKEFGNVSQRPNDRTLNYAMSLTRRQFRLPNRVKMLHLNDVFLMESDIWSKSPGLPWRDLGYATKGDIKRDPDAIRRVRKFWHLVKHGHKLKAPDCLAFARAHTCNIGERKVRAVWGYPATMSFGEAVFAKPLIEAYKAKQHSKPIAYGYEAANGGMKKIVKRFTGHGSYAALDFKKFDKTVPAWLVDIAFDILLENIDIGNYQDHGVASASRSLVMFYYIKDYFINTIIRIQNGDRYQKNTGIASGSFFTQLVGSVCNSILMNWLSLNIDSDEPIDSIYMGDDSLLRTKSTWSLDYCQELMRSIGMELNMQKCQSQKDLHSIVFLGYEINNGIPTKDHESWLVALHCPERPDENYDMVQSRALGLYYANMGIDLVFHRKCYSIIKFRPFELQLSRNFQRMLLHIGIQLNDLNPIDLPNPIDFLKKLM